MSDTSANLFSYCVGGLALLSTVISIVLFYRSYLPSVQMKLLDELLNETKTIFHKVDADGMLPTEASRQFVATTLAAFEEACSSLREDTYRAMTPLDEYFGLLRGNSKRIARLAYEVKKLRSFLLTTDQKESARRAEEARRLAALEAQNMEHSSDIAPPQSADGYQQHSPADGSAPLGSELPTIIQAGPQFTLDPESLTFSSPFEESRQLSRCCFCSFMHWWKAEPSREGLRTTPSLQFSIEELSLPHSDALSRSSTLINHPPSSKHRWLFGALWPRRARSVRKKVTAKLNLTNNHQSIFWGWMSRFISTPSHNTEADPHSDNISLPV